MPQTALMNFTDIERLTLQMQRVQIEMMRLNNSPEKEIDRDSLVMTALLLLERNLRDLLDRFPEEITGRKTEATVEKSLRGLTRLVPRNPEEWEDAQVP